jgi:hypothetical protein
MIRAFAALLAFTSLLSGIGAASQTTTSDRSRAQMSYTALQRHFGTTDGSDLYREHYPSPKGARYSYEWPFSQVHVAVLDLSGLPGSAGAAYTRALAKADAGQMHYWSANAPGGHPGFTSSPQAPYGAGHTLFYDDNEWAGLEAMQDYAQHHSRASLSLAEKVFALAVSGWDRDASHPHRGGVYWMQSHARNSDRNTVSNMPAAELGVRLYQVTHRAFYLRWATRMYRWTTRNLQRPDGLFNDHVDLKGRVDRSLWTYNQGVPIAVDLAFYRATHHSSYLRAAKRLASVTYRYFFVGGRLQSQPVSFNAILFKHLLALESATGGSRYRQAIEAYADRMWRNDRDRRTGVFRFGGNNTDVLEQAAATQIYAVLAWHRGDLAKLA